MKKIITFCASLIFSLVSVHAQDLDAKYGVDLLKPGTAAPEIVINKDGGKMNLLAENKGKYLVLNFWASWCGDCRKELKYLRSINRTYAATDSIEIIGYSFDNEKSAWKKCIKDSALVWQNYLSEIPMRNSRVKRDYHIGWIPTTYIIDKEGKVILATVVIEKVIAKLKEIAPNVRPDYLPLESLIAPEKKKKK